jgi:hypothetical protein
MADDAACAFWAEEKKKLPQSTDFASDKLQYSSDFEPIFLHGSSIIAIEEEDDDGDHMSADEEDAVAAAVAWSWNNSEGPSGLF